MLQAHTHAPARQTGLPPPTEDALEHSRRLVRHIKALIDAHGGAISFRRFMQAALYESGLGYYSAGAAKLGRAGDFITAPEISSLFSRCLARQCMQILELTRDGSILELGAGTGRMAADLMLELARRDCLPTAYLILETSAELRQRQQAYLQASLTAELYARFRWLEALPTPPFRGIILANEVLDAMPVERICYEQGRCYAMQVAYDAAGFLWTRKPPEQELGAQIKMRLAAYQPHFPALYQTELNTLLPAWVRALAGSLHQGLIVLIDYGYTRAEYYHPQRKDGTLLCHYRHRAHHDPLLYVGLQDISASVDFTTLAEAADAAALSVMGYSSQAHFLLACGLDELLAHHARQDAATFLQRSGEAKRLTLPAEMGERFKVIALGRGIDAPLLGFRILDQRERL